MTLVQEPELSSRLSPFPILYYNSSLSSKEYENNSHVPLLFSPFRSVELKLSTLKKKKITRFDIFFKSETSTPPWKFQFLRSVMLIYKELTQAHFFEFLKLSLHITDFCIFIFCRFIGAVGRTYFKNNS